MEKLEALASVVRLSDCIVRILGQNPGKFTLQGTNTYLVGEHTPYTLIDTGEGRPGYIPLLESALQDRMGDPGSEGSGQQHVSDIIISHWHPDHVGGLSSVLKLLRSLWDARNTSLPFRPPRIHKFLHTGLPDERFKLAVESIESGMYEPSPNGSMFHDLHDAQTFPITRTDPSSDPDNFQVIHSPGHTEDSVSLLFPSENALYTADTILGQGTAIFEDLGTYISTLRSLLSYRDKYTVLYPGHGPVVQNGEQVIGMYIQHRMEREGQIVQVLEQAPEDVQGSSWSTWGIVSKIYAGYPLNLWEPAARSVDQHLKKLESEGKVLRLGGEGKDTRWRLMTKL